VAFDLASVSRAPAAASSQIVIGEINLLLIVIPGPGLAYSARASVLSRDSEFCRKLSQIRRIRTESTQTPPLLVHTFAISLFDEYSIWS
jgi:hypothetical protein